MSQAPQSSIWDDSKFRLYELSNVQNTRVIISDFGATIVEINTVDQHDDLGNIVLGYQHLAQYQQGTSSLGATVGPWANRIAQGQFLLDGKKVQLELNETNNHLHGASAGFHKKHWQMIEHTEQKLLLAYTSTPGEAGYDAELTVQVCFSLDDEDCLSIDYKVNSDRPCPVNMTNHSYFNLNPAAENIWQHQLQISATHYLATDKNNIPVAKTSVKDSHFDFTSLRALIANAGKQNIDHCYCISQTTSSDEHGCHFAAHLQDIVTGRSLLIETTEPGIQLYTSEHLGEFINRDGRTCGTNSALCLETQQYPDAVNSSDAEAVILRPGKQYRQVTKYRFNCHMRDK
ncbi:MAG: galactose mutarotase [Oceanospirillaceae bacterium]|nr:galactose mutarotase [Oceanospirillaceae bacterium]